MEEELFFNKEIKSAKYECILNKIKHKPIILEKIYSFSIKRPYIILDLISNNENLKLSLTKVFDNSKKNNDLSSELNKNINNYIKYRKISSKFPTLIKKIYDQFFQQNKKLLKIIQKPNYKINFFEEKKILDFIKNIKKEINENLAIKIICEFFDFNYKNYLQLMCNLYWQKCTQIKKEYDDFEISQEKNWKNDAKYRYFQHLKWEKEKEYKEYYDYYISSHTNENYGKKNYHILYKKIKGNMFNSFFKENNRILINYKYDYTKYFDYYESIQPFFVLNYFLEEMIKNNEVEKFLEIIFYIYKDYFHIFPKEQFQFELYPNITNKYRKQCKNKANSELVNNNFDENKNYKNISIIKKIINEFINVCGIPFIDDKTIINLFFDYLSLQEKCILYNLPKYGTNEDSDTQDFLDEQYLNYIDKLNSNQKIILICIIDRHKYCEYIHNLTYPNFYQLHFVLFNQDELSELFLYNNLPINEIYTIFITYILTIKYYQNIKRISFGDEFFINKNQFLSYNDEYYQSIIAYLIDQYFLYNKKNEKNENILSDMKLEEIKLKEEKLQNIYERYKILYGFNKLFPNLKKSKILQINYNNLINNDYNINEESIYKIIIIDFNNALINDLNLIIKSINNIFANNNNKKNNVEILSFINFQYDNQKSDNNIDIINSNTFYNLPNLKEFFINNNNNKPIINNNLYSHKTENNKFIYLYIGYDQNNNIIFYRNGENRIESLDIIDLFKLLNDEIVRLELKYENITINFNKQRTKLEIINNSKNNKKQDNTKNKENFYYFPLKYFSDFIYQQNQLISLIINGFDFIFDDIKNNNIKQLSINYFTEQDNCDNIFEYKQKLLNYNNYNDKSKELCNEDLYLKNKFPKLEEISLGNIEFIPTLINRLISPENLKIINIITYKNIKKINLNKNIKVNIINKNKNENNNEIYTDENNEDDDEEIKSDVENDEEEEENFDEEEYDDLLIDNYKNILEEENLVVNNIQFKKKKGKKVQNKQNEEVILLIGEKMPSFVIQEEKNMFKKDIINYCKDNKILFFKSELIKSINHFYMIQQSFRLINSNIDFSKINFNLIDYMAISKDTNIKLKDNIFLIFTTLNSNIICLYLQNYEKNKENDFCLLINQNEIYYHKKKNEIEKKKNKKEILRKIYSNERKKEKYLTNTRSIINNFFDNGYNDNDNSEDDDYFLNKKLRQEVLKEVEIFQISFS